MRIGIIGSGRIGATAAKLFTRAGHEVAIANSRGPDPLGAVGQAHVIKACNSMYFGTLGSEGGRRQQAGGPLYDTTMTAPEAERALEEA